MREPRIENAPATAAKITRLRQALARAERERRDLLDSTSEALLVIEPDRLIVLDTNRAGCDLYGLAPEDLVGRSVETLARGPALGGELVGRLGAGRPRIRFETVYDHGNGQARLVDVTCSLVEHDGRPAIACFLRDVSERSVAEQALRSVELRYQILAHATSDAVWDWDLAKDVVWWNEGIATLFGYPPGRVGPDREWWEQRIHPQDRPRVVASLRAVLASGESSWQDEYRFARADGSWAVVLDRGRILRDAYGTAVRMLGALVDISERMQADEALRASEQRLLSFIDNSPAILYAKDLDGRYTIVGRKLEELLGRVRDDIIGRTDDDLVPAEAAEVFRANDRRVIATGEPLEFEEQLRVHDGVHTYISVKFPLVDGAGRVTGTGGVSTDLTAVKQLEEQLRHAQKMEAIGRLAGGVAHDFNNLLTVITGYAELLRARLAPRDPLRADADQIRGAARRAADLTRQLLAFSRKQVLEPRVLNLNALVANLERMLGRLIGEDIELRTELDPALPNVEADPAQLELVIANLVVNARDAMPDGGRVTIRTAVESDEHAGAPLDRTAPGRRVVLEVRDTGCGMDEETRAHVFEPFFTTKEPGKGTGLGLATVYGIVRQSRGSVSVSSEPGRGTSVRVSLPAVDAEAEATSRQAEEAPDGRGTETILLVEDEASVRTLAARTLRAWGYAVVEARGGAEALALAAGYDGRIDLVIADVVMPEMSGPEVVARLRARQPEMRVVFVSGHAEEIVLRRGVSENSDAFLPKPFTPRELVRQVRETLDA